MARMAKGVDWDTTEVRGPGALIKTRRRTRNRFGALLYMELTLSRTADTGQAKFSE